MLNGVPDVTELREGNSPNQAGDGLMCVTYGCAATSPEPSDWSFLIVPRRRTMDGFTKPTSWPPKRRFLMRTWPFWILFLGSGCAATPDEAELRIKIVDGRTKQVLSGALVSIEEGGSTLEIQIPREVVQPILMVFALATRGLRSLTCPRAKTTEFTPSSTTTITARSSFLTSIKTLG